ncbi:WSSV077 [White spot syndrome virus]|uniref:WSSV077 n=1 Tax=White spot syndrome virus TaxID=342409 RepID=A0A2I6SBK5_9VIRU|nr:WSSV077 [White spot syndrome virus]
MPQPTSTVCPQNNLECKKLTEGNSNFVPMTNDQGGTFIKHKETGIWLKTDEENNTSSIKDNDQRRVAKTILAIVEDNRNATIRSRLQSLCFGKYAMNDIFALDDADIKNMDKLIEKLGEALAEKASPSSSAISSSSSSNTTSSSSSPSSSPSSSSSSFSMDYSNNLAKTIPTCLSSSKTNNLMSILLTHHPHHHHHLLLHLPILIMLSTKSGSPTTSNTRI